MLRHNWIDYMRYLYIQQWIPSIYIHPFLYNNILKSLFYDVLFHAVFTAFISAWHSHYNGSPPVSVQTDARASGDVPRETRDGRVPVINDLFIPAHQTRLNKCQAKENGIISSTCRKNLSWLIGFNILSTYARIRLSYRQLATTKKTSLKKTVTCNIMFI